MASTSPNPSLTSREVLAAWRGILGGSAPMLSIEITRECPLSCPGCYAYGESHLGSGDVTLRDLNDLRGDGLLEAHEIRRKPATSDRILKNIERREVNVHWVVTRPMLARPGYLQEYVSFWNARAEVNRIWVSVYTPQVGEQSTEMLTPAD